MKPEPTGVQRQRALKSPLPWLLLVFLLLGLAAADATRPAEAQVTARLYLRAVDFYQQEIHPISSRFIRCRFYPTCSHYSVEAVQRFGIAKGLRLTFTRLARCNRSVRPGTSDPVPGS